MKAFLYGVLLQWKIDFRRKDVLIMYYIMPIVFFLFMGGVFSSINSALKQNLVFIMTVFSVCAGAFVGAPMSIVGFYGSDMRKAYIAGGVPPWATLINSFISAMLHLFIVAIIIMILSPVLFGAEVVTEVFPFLGVTACFMLSALSLGMLLGLLAKTPARLSMISIIVFLFTIMLSGIMLPDEFLPETLRSIGDFLPSRWAFSALMGIDIGKNLLFMGGVFTAAMVLCAVRLRFISRTEE